jgi:hypothetical protein
MIGKSTTEATQRNEQSGNHATDEEMTDVSTSASPQAGTVMNHKRLLQLTDVPMF